MTVYRKVFGNGTMLTVDIKFSLGALLTYHPRHYVILNFFFIEIGYDW